MKTLILVEHHQGIIKDSTRSLVTAARSFSNPCVALVVGYQCQAVLHEISHMNFVDEVWCVDDPSYMYPYPEKVSALVVSLSDVMTHILAASTTYGKNILPYVAALLDVTQVSDVTHIIDHETFEHPIYAGSVIQTVRVLDEKKVLTVRTHLFPATPNRTSGCLVKNIDFVSHMRSAEYLHYEKPQTTRPTLQNASIVVAGGRGLKTAEHFKLIEQLADQCGAAVGATRAAVDEGLISNAHQVGQTGHIVAPLLYIAIGLSGAIQHIAGMKDSQVIVAINQDEKAPIFQFAHYGLIGDLFEIIPELMKVLKLHQNNLVCDDERVLHVLEDVLCAG